MLDWLAIMCNLRKAGKGKERLRLYKLYLIVYTALTSIYKGTLNVNVAVLVHGHTPHPKGTSTHHGHTSTGKFGGNGANYT